MRSLGPRKDISGTWGAFAFKNGPGKGDQYDRRQSADQNG